MATSPDSPPPATTCCAAPAGRRGARPGRGTTGPGARRCERHDTVDLALRYLGLGAPETVPVDAQGRILVPAFADALARGAGEDPALPTIVVLQAGNVHSGAFDDLGAGVDLAHRHGAWVHVDGAFGLWAGAAPGTGHLVAGVDRADSWATDAHKTLNVPYDCGLAIVRDPAAVRAAVGMQGAYLIPDEAGRPARPGARAVPPGPRAAVWAVLRALGRSGVADLVERLCVHATAFAAGLAELPGASVLNDVVFTQVCVSFGDDDRTREVVRRLLADGTVWMSGSTWHGRAVLRISVSNWSTTEDDVARSLAAVRRVVAALEAAPLSR